MGKSGLAFVAGIFGICLNCLAQDAPRAVEVRPFVLPAQHALISQPVTSAPEFAARIANVSLATPWLTMIHPGPFTYLSAFDDTTGLLPQELPEAPVKARTHEKATIATSTGVDDEEASQMMVKRSPFEIHGEIGALYGTSLGGGRGSGEVKQGYIIGTTGNDKFQITAGAMYQDATFRIPARGR